MAVEQYITDEEIEKCQKEADVYEGGRCVCERT